MEWMHIEHGLRDRYGDIPDKLHQLLTRVFAIDFDNFQLGGRVPFHTLRAVNQISMVSFQANGTTVCSHGTQLWSYAINPCLSTWN